MNNYSTIKGFVYNGVPNSFTLMTVDNESIDFTYDRINTPINNNCININNLSYYLSADYIRFILDNSN